MNNSRKFAALLMTTVFSFHQLSLAQKVENTEDASIVTYEKQYFEQYSAVTLLDMLMIIPGGKEILDKNNRQFQGGGANRQGERGFGSGGDQILMDGKRLAGKANNIQDTLSRISATQVEKIELIRGAASGLDVQSQGLVINITMAEGGDTATTFWQVGGKYTFEQDLKPEFLVSRSGKLGGLDYTISVAREHNGFFYDRDEEAFDETNEKTSDQNVFAGMEWKNFSFNSNLGYEFEDGAQLRLNGLYSPGQRDGFEHRIKTTNSINPVSRLTDGDSDKWEVGGDYSRTLGGLGNFKALFVVNSDKTDQTVNLTKGEGAGFFEYANEVSVTDKAEKILRASVTNALTSSQSLELGGEIAINTFDKSFNNNERQNQIDADIDATAADPYVLSNSDDVEIKENRYEVFANHTYNIASDLVLQSSVTAEFSKIVADNVFAGGNSTRRDTSFTYVKPRINLRYDVSQSDQIRATVEKKVSQLDFGNFVTRYDQQAEVLRLGNTNIRPEQIWDYSITFEHRLPNDGGSLEAEVFYRDYTDHITRVDFSSYQNLLGDVITAEEFFALPAGDIATLRDGEMIDFTSKSGNIDGASSIGFKLKSSNRLDSIGLPGAVLSMDYTYEKRRATDQFTGLERNFDRVSDHAFNFNFRHDLTDLGLAYGFGGRLRSTQTSQDISYIWPDKPSGEFEVFAEYNIIEGIKMTVKAENMTGIRSTSVFNFYSDHTRFNEPSGRSERRTNNWTEVTVSLQGTF